MILDATAGNRVIWRTKNPENVIFIDLEKKLERPPTIFADNRKLPFQDKTFSMIYFDPPHAWSWDSIYFGFPDRESFLKYRTNRNDRVPTYYGMNVYKSKTALLTAIYYAQKELRRVLTDTGVLWFNWSELKISLRKTLVCFNDDWIELIRLRTGSKNQTLANTPNFWVCLAKAEPPEKQEVLETFIPMEPQLVFAQG